MFIIYIEPLLLALSQSTDFYPIAYADDVAILAQTWKVKEVLDIINDWSAKNHMVVNIKADGTKTSVMLVAKDRRTLKSKLAVKATEDIKAIGLPVTESYKYLGTEIDQVLSSRPQMKVWTQIVTIKQKYKKLI